ncbi:hypothetical protein PS691_00021 [Pseudomonas fluorescens]|uniref:Terminase n=1 Tax=Pseudomonas fluorescens TaxID=294 RepID=A0A5E6ZG28_PSEFL|nr:hypothetical protein PS691_00021 [Pseudomonas fluorescens]
MGKRHPHFPAWQWRVHPGHPRNPTNRVLQLIALQLFVLGFLLIVTGVFGMSFSSVAIGIVGLLAALVLQRHGHSLEA